MKAVEPIHEIKASLPGHVTSRLLDRPAMKNMIVVDCSESETVDYLDTRLSVGKKKDYVKYRTTELSERHIDEYSHFIVSPKTLDVGRSIEGCTSPPSCPKSNCQVGASLKPPFHFRRPLPDGDIWEIVWVWDTDITLLISERLKHILAQNEVTGLTYDEVPTDHGVLHAAKITQTTQHRAKQIHIRCACKPCRTIMDYVLQDQQLRAVDVLPLDFQRVDSVKVGWRTYRYRRPHWIVSKRVLRLLIDNNAKALTPKGFLLKKPFLPVDVS